MRRWLGALVVLICTTSACRGSAGTPTVAKPTPSVAVGPTPSALYSQEQVGRGAYQLTNNRTRQFVEVTAAGVRTVCSSGDRTKCSDFVLIRVSAYSGNTPVVVSQSQFALANTVGVRHMPEPRRKATRVVQPSELLPTTQLQPDDDTDFASGTLVFLAPNGAGRFRLEWRGHHVATFIKTAQRKLYATR